MNKKSTHTKKKIPEFLTSQGLVIKSTGSHYRVMKCTFDGLNIIDEGPIYDCTIRGKFRLHNLKTTNPIAVGDRVCFQFIPDIFDASAVITELLARDNYILRKSTNLSKQQQILCSNIDQAIIVVTLISPDLSPGLIDRFLVMAGAYHIPCQIIFNKIDLLTAQAFEILDEFSELYEGIGYKVHQISTLDESFRNEIEDVFKNKISFLYGRSGVGKSSLVNLLAPNLMLKTGEVSASSSRGKHTTTYAEMHPIQGGGGYIIDAPGIREFEPTDLNPTEIAHYMPEFLAHIHDCKFNNCTHHEEPGCAVKEAVNSGSISPSRYNSYLMMLLNLEDMSFQDS